MKLNRTLSLFPYLEKRKEKKRKEFGVSDKLIKQVISAVPKTGQARH